MKKSIPERLRLAPEILRWRGPWVFSLLAFRELLSPILFWHVYHIFETDIQRASSKPYAKRKFDVKIYFGERDLRAVIAELAPMGEVTAAMIESRFAAGQAVAVAYADNQAIGSSWIDCSNGSELSFGTRWIVHPDEAIYYGSFTLPQWRGLGVHSCLDAAMNCYALLNGRIRILASVGALNTPSLSLLKRLGRPKKMTLILVHFRGVNWVYRKAIGAPLESRFSVSSPSNDSRNP